jgi:hypothetical protein
MPSALSDILTAVPPTEVARPQTAPAHSGITHTHGQILKSSALISGSSVMIIAAGIIRTKAMTLLLRAGGSRVARSVWIDCGSSSEHCGYRDQQQQCAPDFREAVGSGDTERIARLVTVLRRASILLGVLGAVFACRVR